MEPGRRAPKAQLATVTAVREAGLDCAVFLMPILPYLTDTRAHLDEALRQAKAAGASSVMYTALHLKPGVKQWFMQLRARPTAELVPKYRSMYYGNNAYAPKAYQRWLSERMRPLIRKHGLEHVLADPVTGGVRSAALKTRQIRRHRHDPPMGGARRPAICGVRRPAVVGTAARHTRGAARSIRAVPSDADVKPRAMRHSRAQRSRDSRCCGLRAAIIRRGPPSEPDRRGPCERRITMTLGLPSHLARDSLSRALAFAGHCAAQVYLGIAIIVGVMGRRRPAVPRGGPWSG